MKKWLPCLALFCLVIVTASCQKPEEVTLSKYFNAMKVKDTSTTAAMAIEPFALEYKSWKVLSVDDAVTDNYALPEMAKAYDVMKKSREEQLRLVQDKRYEFDTLKTEMEGARGKKKTELQQKLTTAEEAYKAETDRFTKLQSDMSKKKTEIENEKNLVRLSTGYEQDLETYEGKVVTTRTTLRITTASGDKEYVFLLRRYELINPQTNKPFHNKFVIMKIAPKEELEK